LHLDGHSANPAADARKGADYAHRALEVAGDDPGILSRVAIVLSYFGEDIGAMLALVDRALALDPNSAGSWHSSGLLRNWAGLPDIAIKHIETSVRLSPRISVARSMIQLGLAHFLARRFDVALPLLLLAIQEDPSHPMPQRVLAACYAQMGRLDDARDVVTRLREITPVVIPDAGFLRNPEHRELLLTGLRLAAGDTT
jgi:tetratricopeptide (TPR) repeat protein